jgi:hypothetical protein
MSPVHEIIFGLIGLAATTLIMMMIFNQIFGGN